MRLSQYHELILSTYCLYVPLRKRIDNSQAAIFRDSGNISYIGREHEICAKLNIRKKNPSQVNLTYNASVRQLPMADGIPGDPFVDLATIFGGYCGICRMPWRHGNKHLFKRIPL